MSGKQLKYGDVIKKVGEEKYIRRQKNWDIELSELLEVVGNDYDTCISDSCIIIPDLIATTAECYFTDIYRLKDFHGCERVKDEKIYSYEAYWLLRNKPIQIIGYDKIPKELIHINESIIADWLIIKLGKIIAKRTASKIQIDDFMRKYMNCDSIIEFRRVLKYNFVYRTYTAQTLLLFIEAFVAATEFTLLVS